MSDSPHQIVALRRYAESLYRGLADMTDADSALVSAVAGCSSAVGRLESSALVADGSGNVAVGGAIEAESVVVGGTDVGAALSSLSAAVAAKQGSLVAGSGIVIRDGEVSLGYGVDATVATGSGNLVTSGAVAAAVAGVTVDLPVATSVSRGTVKVGSGLSVTGDGTLSAVPHEDAIGAVKVNGEVLAIVSGAVDIPAAAASAFGVVKVDGTTLTVDGETGVMSVPLATVTTPGVVKVDGATLTVNDEGVVGVTGGGFLKGAALGSLAEDRSNLVSAEDGYAVIPPAGVDAFGVVKVDGTTLSVGSDGVLSIAGAASDVAGVVRLDPNTLSVNSSGQVYVPIATQAITRVLIGGGGDGLVPSLGTLSLPLVSDHDYGLVKFLGPGLSFVSGSKGTVCLDYDTVASRSYVTSTVGSLSTAVGSLSASVVSLGSTVADLSASVAGLGSTIGSINSVLATVLGE